MKIVSPNTRTTLLLDYAWMPINIITARSCFYHFLRKRVTALDLNKNTFNFDQWYNLDNDTNENIISCGGDQPCLRSANDVWILPTIVITCRRFFKPYRSREYSFQELCYFYKNTCQICLKKFPKRDLSIDHIFPKTLGGHNMTSNRLICCKKCNCKKGMHFPYKNIEGNLLKETKIPNNFIFVEDGDMRSEWLDFIWHK